ncbi:fungal-specific transcription factor domain-containing protein [Xylariaceae sp. FL0016]|nr:fungal-specific transcription factor domain-containing protein [Xylariaceae sp. FL0016]
MSPPAPNSGFSAAAAEGGATAATGAPASTTAPSAKIRSCVICRSRKVRCNKDPSGCSNCRRGGVPCTYPSADRPPRWARRLERLAAGHAAAGSQVSQAPSPEAEQVMDRLRGLEALVKELTVQLEQARSSGGSSGAGSPEQEANHVKHSHLRPSMATSNVDQKFGRLVLSDASQSRYVSSAFWTRVNDELDGLKMEAEGLAAGDSDTSDDEASPGKTPSTLELERTPSERHAFMFGHNLNPSASDPDEFHPLPSQVPFLLDVFSENVNSILQIVHMPTVRALARTSRGKETSRLTSGSQALLFSIYYAGVTSMEEDDVMQNFGCSKTHLNLKYRLGLEHALAGADFLNVPDLVSVQAFAIFLFLARRHDSPRFVWMLTGLVVRMAQALGLHRDGSRFEHLTPFEVEMRRRVWWALCLLDLRASEDQGTDLTIAIGSFDTKFPANINDADIDVKTRETPMERVGMTDMSIVVAHCEIIDLMRRMTAPSIKDGPAPLEEQKLLLKEMHERLDDRYLQHASEAEHGSTIYWVVIASIRTAISKMTLITHFPALFSSPYQHFSDEIRDQLLVAAIEVAEHNHALNNEYAARSWRWIFQTYSHWHAIVYILTEVSRRPWSATAERAWLALQSPWLIPAQGKMHKNMRVWIPLRALTAKARKHRDAELARLRADPRAAQQLDTEDHNKPVPTSPSLAPGATEASVAMYRERWHEVLRTSTSGLGPETTNRQKTEAATPPSAAYGAVSVPHNKLAPNIGNHTLASSASLPQSYPPPKLGGLPDQASQEWTEPYPSNDPAFHSQTHSLPYSTTGILESHHAGLLGWLWADDAFPHTTTNNVRDISIPMEEVAPAKNVPAFSDHSNINTNPMELDFDPVTIDPNTMDWFHWVETAKGAEL